MLLVQTEQNSSMVGVAARKSLHEGKYSGDDVAG